MVEELSEEGIGVVRDGPDELNGPELDKLNGPTTGIVVDWPLNRLGDVGFAEYDMLDRVEVVEANTKLLLYGLDQLTVGMMKEKLDSPLPGVTGVGDELPGVDVVVGTSKRARIDAPPHLSRALLGHCTFAAEFGWITAPLRERVWPQ
jgi:hypothetical protein